MRARWIGTLLVVALASAACGKSEQQKQAEAAAAQAQAATAEAQKQAAAATAQAADATKQATQDMAKGLEAMAQGMAAAGAATGDGKPVDPVSFHDLQALFPDLDGWTKGKPHGERMTAPFPYSQADVSYEKGDSRLELKIIDSANHQLLVAPYTMFLAAGYEKETDNGYEKSTKVGGEPGWEKWDSEAKHGELNAIVGKRYIIQTTGSNIADNKVLQDLVAKTDLSKLAAMK
jgi:hypothetical protein